ncbi:SDR family NAD(P)-dependent oxidoreductase [Novosphingobium beihaiensis]|uniref:SDR family oxidoreductase n=1 Tax=Novosphingobium beihaiensis TaxID=2930389 RepID=A0ABT0BSQ1_9SPHN|nr:SDR family oxidoreductase [Novosphingobium beihaiensis]MCJ2187694.1 SDR family oxidoreductase [Novosphingobium beihaiensis]
MKLDLSGRSALVTGSTAGIGFAAAKALADCGAQVFVNGRDAARTAEAADRIGPHAEPVPGDIGTAEGCHAIHAATGPADILINNAGIFEPADFFDTDDEIWDRHWRINVMSAVRLSRAYAPAMVEKGWGRIVMLGSESAFNIPAEMIHYGVSKTADVAFARGLAKRLAGTGVTVNSVLPGPTLSDGLEDMLAGEVAKSGKPVAEVAADFVMVNRPTSIIRRAATVDEVANLIAYIASPLSSATTGASLRVDGGVWDSI